MIKTTHINAEKNAFSKIVLMPGDPIRSKFIAENFLKDAKLINNVRGMQAYTGTYKNKKISVMASGMGMPSMAIFAQELFEFFGVETIIRVGSAGGIVGNNLELNDVVVASDAITVSNILSFMGTKNTIKPCHELVELSKKTAEETNLNVTFGTIFTSDLFYTDNKEILDTQNKCLAVDMESAVLYAIAEKLNKKALAIFSISNIINTPNCLSADERAYGFNNMINFALNVAINIK